MNSENNVLSYRVALDATQADLNDIREQINQLNALKERIEMASEAIKTMITLHEKAMPAAPQPVPEPVPVKAPEPLFGSGFRQIPQFEVQSSQAQEFRSLAALA